MVRALSLKASKPQAPQSSAKGQGRADAAVGAGVGAGKASRPPRPCRNASGRLPLLEPSICVRGSTLRSGRERERGSAGEAFASVQGSSASSLPFDMVNYYSRKILLRYRGWCLHPCSVSAFTSVLILGQLPDVRPTNEYAPAE
ncbi:hypothetical protein ANO11243_072550 [Dothideomycetidae sp. 11243]|nr:hypothetical protein ANO11243_072550 [fungal sp. No.11243]